MAAQSDSISGGRIRQIIVPPLNARRETLYLALAMLGILALMTVRFIIVAVTDTPYYLRPYQKLDSILTGSQPAMYGALTASVSEVVDIRDQEGLWPEVELLEMEMVPPFAKEFSPKDLQGYVWDSHDGSSWVDYIGQDPSGKGEVTFILRLIDLHAEYHPHPHPGVDYDPNEKVAVQIWIFPQGDRPYPGEKLPEAGWQWIVRPDDPSIQKPYDEKKAAVKTKGATP